MQHNLAIYSVGQRGKNKILDKYGGSKIGLIPTLYMTFSRTEDNYGQGGL